MRTHLTVRQRITDGDPSSDPPSKLIIHYEAANSSKGGESQHLSAPRRMRHSFEQGSRQPDGVLSVEKPHDSNRKNSGEATRLSHRVSAEAVEAKMRP